VKRQSYLALAILGSLGLVAWKGHGLREGSAPVMQSWDYKLIEVYNQPSGLTVNWVWEEDGKPLPGSPIRNMVAKANDLGGQGWELLSVSSAGVPVHTLYWFKRPK
jgi:hypothetical protein